MKLADRKEDCFYGAGILKTHIISETDFKEIINIVGKKVKLKKTCCGYLLSRGNYNIREKDYTKEKALEIVDCKKCLKKLKEVKQ